MVTVVTVIYFLYISTKLYASIMQLGFVRRAMTQKAVLLEPSKYYEAGEYVLAKEKLSIFSSVVEYTIFIFWINGGLSWLDLQIVGYSELVSAIIFVLSFVVFNYIITLPFELYTKFIIDERFGYNRSSVALYIKDMLKSAGLTLILGSAVIAGLHYFISTFTNWWLYAFLFLFTIIILANMIYPTIIAPMFNKMSPLESSELKGKIEELLSAFGFDSSGVYVVDASKRDSRLNAYFGGFGKSKRVVLFDTLIEKLETPELLAVLGHELGHFKHGDIYKNMAVMGTLLFGMFFSMGHLGTEELELFNLTYSTHMLMVLFLLLSSPVFFFAMPLIGVISRHNEFEADREAAEFSKTPVYLAKALQKLVEENKSFPKSHPVYIFFYYTHPPILQRLEELGVKLEAESAIAEPSPLDS